MERRHLLSLVGLSPALVALPAAAAPQAEPRQYGDWPTSIILPKATAQLERRSVDWHVTPQDLQRTEDKSPLRKQFEFAIKFFGRNPRLNWEAPLEVEFYTANGEVWLSDGKDPLTVDLKGVCTPLGIRGGIIHRAMDLRGNHHCQDLVGRDRLPLHEVLANQEALWPTWADYFNYRKTLREQIRKVRLTYQLTG